MNQSSDKYSLNGINIFSEDISFLEAEFGRVLNNKDASYHIITFNTDHLRISSHDIDYKSICINSPIVVPDGIGITLLLRLKFGIKLKRITGTDLFSLCLQFANDKSLKVAVVGSTDSVLAELSNVVNNQYPNVILDTIAPPINFELDANTNNLVINRLKMFQPNVLFVALGCPRQEKWISSIKQEVNAKINIGVGAVFEFISGSKIRAPLFFQRIGLEWFWRFLNEPFRLGKRYFLHDFPFFVFFSIRLLLRRDIK